MLWNTDKLHSPRNQLETSKETLMNPPLLTLLLLSSISSLKRLKDNWRLSQLSTARSTYLQFTQEMPSSITCIQLYNKLVVTRFILISQQNLTPEWEPITFSKNLCPLISELPVVSSDLETSNVSRLLSPPTSNTAERCLTTILNTSDISSNCVRLLLLLTRLKLFSERFKLLAVTDLTTELLNS